MRSIKGYERFTKNQANHSDKTQEETLTTDDTMVQMFGQTDKDAKSATKIKRDVDVESLPVPEKDGIERIGFVVLGVALAVISVFLLSESKYGCFFGGVFMVALAFLLAWKVRYTYAESTNYLFYNFTVTLKGLLQHFRTTSILMEVSEKIMIYSVGVMAIQQFLLYGFSLTAILYSIAYYSFFLGVLLNLAKRKTALIYKGLFLYSALQLLFVLQDGFWNWSINYNTVISMLLFWYLACFFREVRITDPKTNPTRED